MKYYNTLRLIASVHRFRGGGWATQNIKNSSLVVILIYGACTKLAKFLLRGLLQQTRVDIFPSRLQLCFRLRYDR